MEKTEEIADCNLDPSCFSKSNLENAAKSYKEDLEYGFLHLKDDLEDRRTIPQPGLPELGTGTNKVSDPKQAEGTRAVSPKTEENIAIDSKTRGVMLIFNNRKYPPNHTKEKYRRGSTADAFRAEKTWKQLGFDVYNYEDKRGHEILDIVKKISANPELKSRKCFGITLMGHGEEGKLITFGGTELLISTLITQVQECVDLRGIPKLFFIQACRGPERMQKVAYQVDYQTPLRADTLVHYATYEDYVSTRSPDYKINGKKVGAWFIYALAQVVNEMDFNEEIEIHRVLTRVNNKVSHFVGEIEETDERGKRIKLEFCQMPEFRSTMRQDLMLSKSNVVEGTFYKKMREQFRQYFV